MVKTKLNIEGMSCEHCARAVKQAIESVAGVKGVAVDLVGRTAEFEMDKVDIAAVIAAVEEEGYRASL
ncbi:MAG TPA: cation transporter [Fimbriimonadaceae bacterium]|nr:cation transporter [Fimbriimonadaceae bacterium]